MAEENQTKPEEKKEEIIESKIKSLPTAGEVISEGEVFLVKNITPQKKAAEQTIGDINNGQMPNLKPVEVKKDPKVKQFFDRFYKKDPVFQNKVDERINQTNGYFSKKQKTVIFYVIIALAIIISISLIWGNINISKGKFQGNTTLTNNIDGSTINVENNNTVPVNVYNNISIVNNYNVTLSLPQDFINQIRNAT